MRFCVESNKCRIVDDCVMRMNFGKTLFFDPKRGLQLERRTLYAFLQLFARNNNFFVGEKLGKKESLFSNSSPAAIITARTRLFSAESEKSPRF